MNRVQYLKKILYLKKDYNKARMGFLNWVKNIAVGALNLVGDMAAGAGLGFMVGGPLGAGVGSVIGLLGGGIYESYQATQRIMNDEDPSVMDWVTAGVGAIAGPLSTEARIAGAGGRLVKMADMANKGATASNIANTVGGKANSVFSHRQNSHYNGYLNRVSAETGMDPRFAASLGDNAGRNLLATTASKTNVNNSHFQMVKYAYALNYAGQLKNPVNQGASTS